MADLSPRMKGALACPLALLGMVLALAPVLALADHGGKSKHGKGENQPAVAATSLLYEQECGACHWAFFPGLLPARSWDKLLSQPGEHFGEQLPTTSPDLARVREFLRTNAADRSPNKRAQKIMKSIGSTTPLRVSEVAYVRDKHRGVSHEILARKSVGGLGNCLACHPGAKSGDFDDDRVSIPR